MPKVLAILITYNAESWLPISMGALQKISHLVDLAVVDNNSQDATKEILEQNYSDLIKYSFYLDENLGFGKAHNLVFGKKFANEYDYFFLLNQDAAIDAVNFERLLSLGEKASDYAILSPLHYFSEKDLDKNFSKYLAASKPDEKISGIREVPFVNAAIWLIKAPVLLEINGFHPIFPHYGEDLNLVHRLTAKGWLTGIVPDTVGYHYRPQPTKMHWLDDTPYRMMISCRVLIFNPLKSRLYVFIQLNYRLMRLVLRCLFKGRISELRQHLANFFTLYPLFFASFGKDLIYAESSVTI
ncbi:hypothetical protein CEQ90_06490 [Lewinellaceae bacterium SD302]|nr:hypothetical protein CEQ90_06490 [Lewinellaceae bacterium SD302]